MPNALIKCYRPVLLRYMFHYLLQKESKREFVDLPRNKTSLKQISLTFT